MYDAFGKVFTANREYSGKSARSHHVLDENEGSPLGDIRDKQRAPFPATIILRVIFFPSSSISLYEYRATRFFQYRFPHAFIFISSLQAEQ